MKYDVSAGEQSIVNELKSRNFSGFLHMTDLDHLHEILNAGFIGSRDYEKSKELGLNDLANQEVIDKTPDWVKGCARFYYYKGTPTYYNFEKKRPNDLVMLVFDWNIIKLDGAMVTDGNPASGYSKKMPAKEYLDSDGSFLDFNGIFHRSPLPKFGVPFEQLNDSERKALKEKNEIIRKRNAELDVPDKVPLDHVRMIVFKSQSSYNRFWSDVRNKKLGHGYKFRSKVDRSFFCLQ